VQVVLGEGHGAETEVLGELRQFDDLLDHLLEAIVVGRDRPQPLAVLERARDRGIEEEHEFHRELRYSSSYARGLRRAERSKSRRGPLARE